MAIYRGAGGAGDATGDATNASALALAARDEAITAANSASSSATSASNSATAAESSATDAATSETNAAGSASTASTAATNASGFASDASDSADAAASSASDAADSATAAASSASAASTSETNATSSASSALSSASSASTSASTATTKASEASTSATNAASSASTASTAATNASNSASAASTSETNAASSASSASTSASAASTSASTASTAATNASTSASTASTQATNAATSATNAYNAQTAAESARDATLAAFDSFDDRYLGAKIADPVLDNDGNPLAAGELYFNTISGVMKVYTGTVWVAAYVSSEGLLAAENNLSDLDNSSTARTNLGLGNAATATIGTDVQAYDADLAAIASSGKGAEIASYGTYGVGFKNRIINGAMMIDQRNAGASVTLTNAGNTFPVDRFQFYKDNSSATVTGQKSSVAPTGFNNSLSVSVTTGAASSAAQELVMYQNVEGFNVADFGFGAAGSSSIVLSFWVRSSLTGTFAGAVSNNGATRTYIFTYTINSANTWEQKTVTIAGDTSGTWLKTNGAGLGVKFDLGSGSNFNGTAGAWTTGNIYSVSGASKVMATTGATFYITGVQLEKGTVATSFDYRPYGTELALAQRYYYRLKAGSSYANAGTGRAYSTTNGQAVVAMPVSMRATPNGGYSALTDWNAAGSGSITAMSPASQFSADFRQMSVDITMSFINGQSVILNANNTTNAWIDWSAEL